MMVSMVWLVSHHINSRLAGSAGAVPPTKPAVGWAAGVSAGAADSVVSMGGIWGKGVGAGAS